MNRTKMAKINVLTSIVTQVIWIALSFINRTVFTKVLGVEYLGVNGLYTSVLTILSFAELGLGSAIAFALYKPLNEKDHKKIQQLMDWFKQLYHMVAIVVLILGLSIIPFLSKIVGEVPSVKDNLIVIYLLFLSNTVVSYLCIYKITLINADQKNYLIVTWQLLFKFIGTILQIIFLLITKMYLVYLLINIILQISTNIFLSLYTNYLYPYIKEKNGDKLSKKDKHKIFVDIKALLVYKVAGIAIDSTDNIFISLLLNVATVGLYSNYYLITSLFNGIISKALQSIMGVVGNLIVEDDHSTVENVFNQLFMVGAVFTGFFTIGIYMCINDVIELWLGNQYLLDKDIVISICMMFYFQTLHLPLYIFRTAGGVFKNGWMVPLIAAPMNIFLDYILGSKFGLIGIFSATIFTRLVTYEIWDPIFVYKYIIKTKVYKYFLRYAGFFLLNIGIAVTLEYICQYLFIDISIIECVEKIVFVTLFFGIFEILILRKTKSFMALKQRIFYSIFRKK